MNNDVLVKLASELLSELESFVDGEGGSSYISDEEKEEQYHIKAARELIARARDTIKKFKD